MLRHFFHFSSGQSLKRIVQGKKKKNLGTFTEALFARGPRHFLGSSVYHDVLGQIPAENNAHHTL
jgi:hypothetical protein